MKFQWILTISLVVLLIQCHHVKSQDADAEEPTTKKPGFFSRWFGKGGSTTTTTTTTTTTQRSVPVVTSRKPISPAQPGSGYQNPNDPFSNPNMRLGPVPPYQRPNQQPSGLSLSYGPTQPSLSGKQHPGSSSFLAPMSTPSISPITSTTTTARPKLSIPQAPLAKADDFSDFDDPKKHISSSGPSVTSTTTTTTTRRPTPKEDFPALPPPRKPSIKEDFPALPSRPSSPGGPSSIPQSPSIWSTTPSTPGNRVQFVPHVPASSTIKPGSATTEKPLASDDEIRELTETLYNKETNSQFKLINVNIQGKTRSIDSSDEAPQPLLQVDAKALEPPTIALMRDLFNNYELDTTVNEHVTPMERKEENDFVDAVMATNVMRQAMQFLQNKGLVSPDPKTHRELVKTIWFTQYSRGQGKIGSSGFEHVFVSEVKNGTLIGLHNWVYFSDEEKAGHIDYKGYLKKLDLGNKGLVLKARFTHNGVNKPVNGIFIGTSPELELALYTVCFELRADKLCPVSLGGNRFDIQTYSWRYRGKSLIGSAYPDI